MYFLRLDRGLSYSEKAHEVARFLLKEIIPWFGIPVTMRLENELMFMAEVVQLVTKGLKVTWKLHTAYCPRALKGWGK